LTIAPVHDADGCLAGYVSSHQDISQIKKLDRARRQFMTNVSHQLRTPVTSIKLYAQMLQRRDLPAEKTEGYLQVIGEQADRLAHLIQDMLDMVTLDRGEVITESEPISLPRLIRNMLRRYHSTAKAAGLILLADPPPPDLPAVNGDPMWLLRALGEVVENAITFTVMQDRDGGQITVAVDKTEDEGKPWVTLSVRDAGPGISPEEQEYIFDRFDRGRLTESGHIPGAGLGLSIAREILLAHGGRLTVQSELGKGSTFTLWLPTVPGEDPPK
jgi:signal transduction histidine kinase